MSQSREIPESERAKFTRDPPDGSIDNAFSFRLPGIKRGISNGVEIGGLKWKFGVEKKSLDDKEFLYVSLIPQRFKSPPWSIELTAEFILRHDTDDKKNVSKMLHYILRDFTEPHGCYIMPWNDLIDEDKGFISGNELEVTLRLTILKGLICNPASFDFSSSGDVHSDVVLLIGGNHVHVNKYYLGLYSPVFKTMFFGDFAEKGKDEIELKDVEYHAFIELLNVIYPSQKNITECYAEHLIKLADRFQIPSVIYRAEDTIIASSWHTSMEKMRIADKYKLFKLLEHCLSELKRTKDFQAIKNDPIYEGLSETTKSALFERVVEVAK